MFLARMRLFRVHGIPINVDASWLIILALLTLTLTGFYQQAVPDLTPGSYWALGIGTALAFFTCIVLHELGHALVARRLGIPLRGITLFLFGGVAEMEGEPKKASHEFSMAIAGPVVSAVLAGLFWGLAVLGDQVGWATAAVVGLGYLAFINMAILVFNLVPAFPLDGGRVLRSILWGATGNLRRATYWASLLGQGFAWLLIGLGVVSFFLGDFLGGLWLGLIGMFLNSAAQASYQQVLIRQALRGEPVRRFMNLHPITVPPETTLREWVEEYVYRHHHKAYPVVANGVLEGVISTGALGRYARQDWGSHTVGEAMRQDVSEVSIHPETDALRALERMQRTGSSRLLVTEDGRHLMGLVSLKDLLRFLQLKLELEGQEDEDREPPVYPRDSSRREQTPAHV